MQIPAVVIDRLPLYARALAALEAEKRQVVSSLDLGTRLGMTPAQIRKDLSYFGRFGKQGRGYNVLRLTEELRRILGLHRQWRMALIGVGRLGRAILGYDGFTRQGFRFVEAFDASQEAIGQTVGNLIVKDAKDLRSELANNPVDIGVVAVPGQHAQEVSDALINSGIHAILNYAPTAVLVPESVRLKQMDPVIALQSMTYHLKIEKGLGRKP